MVWDGVGVGELLAVRDGVGLGLDEPLGRGLAELWDGVGLDEEEPDGFGLDEPLGLGDPLLLPLALGVWLGPSGLQKSVPGMQWVRFT